ncbi:phage tail protein [Salinigranum salinum]|uniref:phage tail protein n=1 Tax=Salinigranum salinum TaxID=1364937 RepID=UPI0012605509|nr:phage tail protein [Salinigranum salinum]
MSAERTDPYRGFRFHVEIDDLIVGGFSEVSGLEVEVRTEEYEEGGVNGFVHKLPTRVQHPNLVLERGLTDSTVFWDWIEATTSPPVTRRNVRVLVLDSLGQETWGWECREALPVQWSGPTLQADQGTVALESLELVHRGISRMRPP